MVASEASDQSARPANGGGKLRKELGLWDVYCISTGTMFSSGFFLLPGLATAQAGPSTALAYLIAGFLMVPAMLSIAELSTALPRAGGAYYFLDRSLGPAIGAVGGLGTWLALVLKSGFALLGMGAYLAITPLIRDLLPQGEGQSLWIIKGVAVALTVVFTVFNIMGAKETTRLQSILVAALLAVLSFFVVQGLWYVFFRLPEGEIQRQFTPFMHAEHGFEGMVATIGLVFVSYAGLTQIASVSEEVKRPERNLPMGMFLSLATATFIYVVGVFIMIAVLDPERLRSDYTPVATAAEAFFSWLPEPLGLILVVIAALAAFASTGNAGILSASRYPLAMARDGLISERLGGIGRFGTPTAGIVASAALMILFILALDAEGVAKAASAFNLLVFGLVCVAVIVMRESRIESYDPGYRSPFYPWTQIAGIIISFGLIFQMGWLAVGLTVGAVCLALFWYVYYARAHVVRDGAIYHVFERLGQQRFEGLDREFRDILKEKGARQEDPFDDVVSRAVVIEGAAGDGFEDVVRAAAERLAERVGLPPSELVERFMESARFGFAPISHNAMLPHFRLPEIDRPEMALVRSREGVAAPLAVDTHTGHAREVGPGEAKKARQEATVNLEISQIHAIFLLVSPEEDPGQHLRILAQVAGRIENEDFMKEWRAVRDEQKLKELLLRDERFLALRVRSTSRTAEMIGKRLREIRWPEGTLVTLIRRDGQIFAPRGSTTLEDGDRLTIIGEPRGISRLYEDYVAVHAEEDDADTGDADSQSMSARSSRHADEQEDEERDTEPN